jgi:hypothetical protein
MVNHAPVNLDSLVCMKHIWTYEVSGPKHWLQPTNATFVFQYRPRNDMLEMQHIATSYDVLIMNFGLTQSTAMVELNTATI